MSLTSPATGMANRARSRSIRETHVVALTGPEDITRPRLNSGDKTNSISGNVAQYSSTSPTTISGSRPFGPPPKPATRSQSSSQSDLERLKKLKEDILMGQHPLYHASPHPEALESLSLVHNPPTEDQTANYSRQQPPQNLPSRQLASRGSDAPTSQHRSEPSSSRQINSLGSDLLSSQRQIIQSGLVPSQQSFGHDLSIGGPRGLFDGISDDRPRWESTGSRDVSGQVSNSLNRPHTPAVSSYLNGRPSLPTPQSIPSSAHQYSNRSSGAGNVVGNAVSDHSSRQASLSGPGTRHDLRTDGSGGSIGQNNHSNSSSYRTMTPTPVPPGVNNALPSHRIPPRPPNQVGPPQSPVSAQRDIPSRSHATNQPVRTEPPVLLKRSEVQIMEGRMALPGSSVPSPQDQPTSRPRDAGLRPTETDIREPQKSSGVPRSYDAVRDVYVPSDSPSIDRRPDKPPLDTNEIHNGRSAGSVRAYNRSSPPSDRALDLYGQGPRDPRREEQYDSRYPDDLRRGRPEYRDDYRGRRPLDTRQDSGMRSRNHTSPRPFDRDPLPGDKPPDSLPPSIDRTIPPSHSGGRPISSQDALHSSDGPVHGREVSSTRPYDIRRDAPAPYGQGRQNYPPDSRPRGPVSSEARPLDDRHDTFSPDPRQPSSPARSVRRDPDFNERASYPGNRSRSREWVPRDDRDRSASFQTGPNSRTGWTNGDRRGDDPARRNRDVRDRLPPLPPPDSMKRPREDDYDLGPKRFPPPSLPSVPIRGPSPPPVWDRRSRSSSRGPGARGPDPYAPRDSFSSIDRLSTHQAPIDESASRIRTRSMSPPPVYSRPVYAPGPRPSIPESDAARSAKRARLEDGYERATSYRPNEFPNDYHFGDQMDDRRGAPPPRPLDNRRPYGHLRGGGPPPPPMRDSIRGGPPGRSSGYLPPRPRSPLLLSASYRGPPRDVGPGSSYHPRPGLPPYPPPGWERNDRDVSRYPLHTP